MDFSLTELGKRIAHRRKQFGMKQNTLAERLDISNNHMSSIETGKTQPSVILLYQICNELKVTPDYLMMGALRSSDIPQALIDTLRLCTPEDIELLYNIASFMAQRNSNNWNDKKFV